MLSAVFFSHHRFPFFIFPRFCSSLLKLGVTELEKGGDWQVPLQVIWSKPSVQAGTPRPPRPGPTPNLFFLYLHRGTLLHLPGQSVPVPGQPHSKKCFLFLILRENLCFSLCPLPLVLPLDTSEKKLSPFSLHLPFRCSYVH